MIVAQRSEGVAIGAGAEGVDGSGVEFGSREAVAGGDVTEAHESVHEGESPRIVELEAGNALSGGGDCRLRQLSQLPAIKERFDDVLLDGQVIVVDCRAGRTTGSVSKRSRVGVWTGCAGFCRSRTASRWRRLCARCFAFSTRR